MPEQVPRDCTKERTNQGSQQRRPSKKAEPATKDDTAMFASASNLPFGPTHKSPKNCGDNPLTIDPFVHTHLPFNLPNGFSSPPSPVRSVPIQREGVEQSHLGNKRESKSQSNFSGTDELNRLHDGLEVICMNTFTFISYQHFHIYFILTLLHFFDAFLKDARGRLSAQAKKLLERQEEVEHTLRRGKEASLSREQGLALPRGQESPLSSDQETRGVVRPREQERGRRGRPEARSHSFDPTNRGSEDGSRCWFNLESLR